LRKERIKSGNKITGNTVNFILPKMPLVYLKVHPRINPYGSSDYLVLLCCLRLAALKALLVTRVPRHASSSCLALGHVSRKVIWVGVLDL
jgi:hypothetical protein